MSNIIKLNDIDINDIEQVLKSYLLIKHPSHSNGFIIRLSDKITESFERRRTYIIKFPYIIDYNSSLINDIINQWSDYALENVIENYDLNQQMTIVSIDPINIDKIFDNIQIHYSGSTINPENLVRSLSFDIIEQMNRRIIETYMDKEHPEIDIADSDQIEKFNEIFDDIDMDEIYARYKYADVYIGISLGATKSIDDIDSNPFIYVNATILTNSKIIDIIDEIRMCLDFNDTSEIFNYIKDDIVFKFSTKNEIKSFSIITDPDI
jgi:hypothetical protein